MAKAALLPGRFFGVSFFVDESHHSPYSVTEAIEYEWGTIHKRLTAETQYLVIGPRKNGKPHASEKQAAELSRKGAAIKVLNEAKCAALLAPSGPLFADWVRQGKAGEQHADHVIRAIRPGRRQPHDRRR